MILIIHELSTARAKKNGAMKTIQTGRIGKAAFDYD